MPPPIGQQDENAGYLGYGPNETHYGQMTSQVSEGSGFPSLDFYGAIYRRKFIVILLSLVGAGIGYLFFSSAIPVYASSLRLMIWVQSPPTIVNGEVISQSVSISKQQNLIASQMVLGNAAKNGGMDQFKSFQGSPHIPTALRSMLKIVPIDKNADALELTMTGTVAEDLPPILEHIVAAYIGIIEEDTVASGKESVALIERLQQKLEEDQKQDYTKYYKILKQLNLSSENESGKWVNPNLADITRLKQERDDLVKKTEDSDQKIRTLRSAFAPENNDANPMKRLMIIEAKKVLGLPDERLADGLEYLSVDERSTYSRLQSRLGMLEEKIFTYDIELEDLLPKFGPNHQAVASIQSLRRSYDSKRNTTASEISDLLKGNAVSRKDTKEGEGVTQDARKREKELILLYGAKLATEQANDTKQFTKIAEQLGKLEESSKLISADMAEVNMLKLQINERRDSVAKILDKLSAINVLSNNYTTTKVRVIDSASMARKISPKLLTYLAFGSIAAGLLGIGLAILIDQSDLSYRTPIDIQQSLAVPVICKIPKIRNKQKAPGVEYSPTLVSTLNPQSPAAETFRALRTSILFAANQCSGKVFLFTSPAPGDGKSTTSSNLAISLAQAKKKVVLVDADFRRPRVHQNFGVRIEPGCVEVLSGAISLDEALRPCEFQSNLTLLTSGGRPKDAGELIASSEFSSLIDDLRQRFDLVIIDSPPILPVADSTSLSSVVDGVFLVLRIRKGVMIAARKAKERLDMVQANVMGVVVNGMDENLFYNEYGTYYRGAYYSGYEKYYNSQNYRYAERSAKERNRALKESEQTTK